MALAAGARLGPYEILGLIGAGGMGEVYRGRDTRLDRTVAIKILPCELATDVERRTRFEREARIVAALNHPNIVTIYSVEEAGGSPFLTMELIEGSRLDELIPEDGLPVDRLLKHGVAIADALAAAQQRGVVHRDLKPANIMVTPAGQVKVLDFGIAKLQPPSLPDGMATALSTDQTGEGRIVGSLAYMSPEQAEGRAVDSRSDIFSFGVILHQMATGKLPFRGDTPVSLLSSIVKETPGSVTALRPALPAELGRVVRRCLTKDPDRRYQSATDLRNDLEDLQAAILSEHTPSGVARGPAGRWSSRRLRAMGPALVLATLAAAVLVVAGVRWRLGPRPAVEPISLTAMTMTRLTTSGNVERAVIAPDGRYVAHVVNDGGQRSLWLRQVATSSNVQIVPPAQAFYAGLAFSPDGDYVYYSTYERGYGVATLWQVPVLGGTPRKILNDVDSPVSFSPDGRRFVFVRNVMTPAEGRLVVADADGANERVVASRKAPERFDLYVAPAWSPDGARVAVSQVLMQGGRQERIAVFDVNTGTAHPLGRSRWREVHDVAWLADGSALAVSAREHYATNRQLWRVAYPGGDVTRITNDLTSYTGLSLAAGSRTLVTVQEEPDSHIWVAPSGDLARARQALPGGGRYDGFQGIAWAPDGRLVYTSATTGNFDIWIMDADGRHRRQLTVDPAIDVLPDVTRDGRFIVFTSTRSGASQVWRMDIDGANPVQLARHNMSGNPVCDGTSVVYNAVTPDEARTVWRVSVDGGEAEQVSDQAVVVQALSPDGRFVVGTTWSASENRYRLGIVALGTPGPPAFLPVFPQLGVAWTPRGDALAYVDMNAGAMNIFSRPLRNGTPTQLTTFSEGQVFDFAWSHDGTRLALARGTISTDVVLLSARNPAR